MSPSSRRPARPAPTADSALAADTYPRAGHGRIRRTTKRHSRLDPTDRGSIIVQWHGYADVRHSLRTIAEGAGLSYSEVSRVLNGQRTGRLQTLAKIAAHLGLTLDALNAYLITQRPKHKR